MGFTGSSSLDVLVAVIAGVLATVGAIVALTLVAGIVHGGLAMAGRLAGTRLGSVDIENRTVWTVGPPVVDGGGVGPGPDHVLLARQAWWRLRC